MGEENVGKSFLRPQRSALMLYIVKRTIAIYVDSFLQQHSFSVNVNCLLRIKMYLCTLIKYYVAI